LKQKAPGFASLYPGYVTMATRHRNNNCNKPQCVALGVLIHPRSWWFVLAPIRLIPKLIR